MPTLLTKSEAAKMLRVSVSTVHRWLRIGRLRSTKIERSVRILESDLLAMIGDGRTNINTERIDNDSVHLEQ